MQSLQHDDEPGGDAPAGPRHARQSGQPAAAAGDFSRPACARDPRAIGNGERSLDLLRWGFPPPPNLGSRPVTNVRNTASSYWRPWLAQGFRCLVPATSFCEYTDSLPKVPHWFALDDSRPLFAFAGIWRPWTGERKKETREHLLYAILTTAANDVVRPIHAKAMPVILTRENWDSWLDGESEQALSLARPLANEAIRIVATGKREDVRNRDTKGRCGGGCISANG